MGWQIRIFGASSYTVFFPRHFMLCSNRWKKSKGLRSAVVVLVVVVREEKIGERRNKGDKLVTGSSSIEEKRE
jgi:hypothetical protein